MRVQQIYTNEGADNMQHSNNIAVANIEGQVVDRGEGYGRRRRIIQRKQDTSNNLNNEHHKEQEPIQVI
jgi:hypothetical protein